LSLTVKLIGLEKGLLNRRFDVSEARRFFWDLSRLRFSSFDNVTDSRLLNTSLPDSFL